MRLNPKAEDVFEILPHVAAVAAAYGDPKGTYAAFMGNTMSNYQSKSFWFYDQTGALPSSPAAQSKHKSESTMSNSDSGMYEHFKTLLCGSLTLLNCTENNGTSLKSTQDQPIPFECPQVFALVASVEIDDGIFVTCDELKQFYEIPVPVDLDT